MLWVNSSSIFWQSIIIKENEERKNLFGNKWLLMADPYTLSHIEIGMCLDLGWTDEKIMFIGFSNTLMDYESGMCITSACAYKQWLQ